MKKIKWQPFSDEPRKFRWIVLELIGLVILIATILGLFIYLAIKRTSVEAKPATGALTDYCSLSDVICEGEEIPTIQTKHAVNAESSPRIASTGKYQVTAYAWTGNKTASGVYPEIGMCASNDFAFGTKIELTDLGITCVVKDRGGMGHGVIDVFMGSRQEAINFGRKTSSIKIIK